MNPNESDHESESFRSAAAALAGLPLATVDFKPFDFGKLGEKGVHAGLSGALKRVKSSNTLALSPKDKYIIFSDHHRGTRDGNDDFQFCEETYGNALRYYLYETDYKLVILGDGEECWEDKAEDILDAYDGIFKLEAEFHKGKRYIRVSGNHDAIWESEKMVEQYLHPIFPGLKVQEGIVFNYDYGGKHPGVLFLVHGHQGTLDSELFKPLSEALVRTFYRPYQQITGGGRTTPAMNIALRAAHDTQIYRWAKKQRGLIVIAGHTHRPVWCSRTHLEKLVGELNQMLEPQSKDQVRVKANEITERVSKYPTGGDSILEKLVGELNQMLEPQPKDHVRAKVNEIKERVHKDPPGGDCILEALVSELNHMLQPQPKDQALWAKVNEIKEREYKYPPGGDSIKFEPSYFNTGCCRFKDGDITGIELAGGEIRLVRWGRGVADPKDRVLEHMQLASIFEVLELTRSGLWVPSKTDEAETLKAAEAIADASVAA